VLQSQEPCWPAERQRRGKACGLQTRTNDNQDKRSLVQNSQKESSAHAHSDRRQHELTAIIKIHILAERALMAKD
jgi:hypothetical protein